MCLGRRSHYSRERGVSTVEACIALPVVYIALLAAFSIAQFFFLGSKLIHLTSSAAVSLRATAQVGEDITFNPQYTQLIYSTNPSLKNDQRAWYFKPSSSTGIKEQSKVHMMFLNLFLGTVKKAFPSMMTPPPYRKTKTFLENAVEVNLKKKQNLAKKQTDTLVTLKTSPSLFNVLNKILTTGAPELILRSSALLLDMDIADTSQPANKIDYTYFENLTTTYQGTKNISSMFGSNGSSLNGEPSPGGTTP